MPLSAQAIGPVTLATYQIVTYRPKKDGDFPHFGLFNQRDWGLIIYDEVHLLPAPVFRATADIQARRRLGLTATLVREDGHEDDVFSLIGPKKYDVPWRDLERQGAIGKVHEHIYALPGVSTPVAVSAGHGRSIGADLKAGGVEGVLLVAT